MNLAWNISLGFLLLAVWKERSQRIFKREKRTAMELWETIVQNIRVTILAEKWYPDEWETMPQECRIMERLNLSR